MLEKSKKLNKAIDKLNEKYGNKVIYPASEYVNNELLPSPWATVNNLTGGGVPRGRFTTVVGPSQVGKTTILFQWIAHLQSLDPNFYALLTETENSLDRAWMEKLGIDMDRLFIQDFSSGISLGKINMESILQAGLDLIEDSRAIDLWMINSLGGLMPKAEVEKDLEGNTMMDFPKRMGLFYRKANPIVSPFGDFKGTAVVFVGHVYTVPTTTGVSLEEVRGGNAVKHWAHVRLSMRRGPRDEGPDPVNIRMPDGKTKKLPLGWAGRVRLEKTRQNDKEGQEVLVPFRLGVGFDSQEATIQAAFGQGLITRSGPTYSHSTFPDGKLKGREAVIKFLKESPEALQKISDELTNIVVSDIGTILAEEPQEEPSE